MKRFLLPACLLTVLTTLAALASAATVGEAVAQIQRERIQSSYLIAFGRKASDGEVSYWAQQNPRSVSELVARHNEYLQRDQGTHRDTIRRSYNHAFGLSPNDGEYRHWMAGSDNYTELMKKHVEWLKGSPAQYDEVLRRSYQNTLRRQPVAAELAWWKSQGTFSYVMLAAAHENWAQRNSTASPRTSGRPAAAASSQFLTTLAVSPTIATEARSAAGLIGNDAGSLVGPDGASIVGNAGGNIVAAGAGNIVAAGAGNIVAAGAGN